jgi:hypothetical protein
LNLIIVFSRTPGASGTLTVGNWRYPDPKWIGYGLTVVQDETGMTMTYVTKDPEWYDNNAQLAVVNFDGSKDAILFPYTGVAGQDYLFKIEGPGTGNAREVIVTADGTAQVATIDLSGLTVEQRNALNLIIVFSRTPGASGTLTVGNWMYGGD